ncbi:hypothetical protein CYMTET_31373 [Cymbomonas tetramitiformis]|uniref:Uncharacterized protein n=1 Tax=Cymbomonas tetramitiformis TaxID=36881 RepID=A0AAE0FH41_9CHLO|nr:hypothetical protein CYMTET_31373 [Cymbomonas tetramitiformis]
MTSKADDSPIVFEEVGELSMGQFSEAGVSTHLVDTNDTQGIAVLGSDGGFTLWQMQSLFQVAMETKEVLQRTGQPRSTTSGSEASSTAQDEVLQRTGQPRSTTSGSEASSTAQDERDRPQSLECSAVSVKIEGVHFLAFSMDGSLLAACTHESLHLYDVHDLLHGAGAASQPVECRVVEPGEHVAQLRWSSQQLQLLVVTTRGHLFSLHPPSAPGLHSLAKPAPLAGGVHAVDWNPCGSLFVFASETQLRVRRAEEPSLDACALPLPDPEAAVCSISWALPSCLILGVETAAGRQMSSGAVVAPDSEHYLLEVTWQRHEELAVDESTLKICEVAGSRCPHPRPGALGQPFQCAAINLGWCSLVYFASTTAHVTVYQLMDKECEAGSPEAAAAPGALVVDLPLLSPILAETRVLGLAVSCPSATVRASVSLARARVRGCGSRAAVPERVRRAGRDDGISVFYEGPAEANGTA